MDLNSYQAEAVKTAAYPDDARVVYPLLGLAGEALGKWKKLLRGDTLGAGGDRETAEKRARYETAKELGDVLWYVAALARDLGFTLEEVATQNLAKLSDRKDRGVIRGSGDDR